MPVTVGEKAVVGTKRIRVDRPAPGDFLLDNKPENCPRGIRYRACINPAVALKKPENGDFPGCASSTVTFEMTAEI